MIMRVRKSPKSLRPPPACSLGSRSGFGIMDREIMAVLLYILSMIAGILARWAHWEYHRGPECYSGAVGGLTNSHG